MRNDPELFDIIVIGAGSGGLNIAGFANRVGLKVLLIDKEDRTIGGDCLNHGCVPSKALIHIARQIRQGRRSERFGLSMSGTVDMRKIMESVRDKQEHIRKHENADFFRNLGMRVALGTASFVDRQTVVVGTDKYRGKKIILATGSRPRQLDIPGIGSAPVHTNETLFSLETVPERMVIIGAGPIGIELGQAMSAFGTRVTVVGPKLLEKEDPEIVSILRGALEAEGMEFVLGYQPAEVRDGKRLIIRNDTGESRELPFDALFVSIGREPNTDGLDLARAGIELDSRGRIIADRYLRTTNPRVLVCGDVAGGHMFTHAAELHASVIINNLFSPLKKKLNTDSMAWVTYTSPEIATFGLNERTLTERGIPYDLIDRDFSGDDRAIVDEYSGSRMKLFLSKRGEILGGSMVAPQAGELVQELILAQANGLRMKDFLKKVYPYPVATRINRSIALTVLGNKLTDRTQSMLRRLFH